ncbi:MAG TPA: D-alanine--D-alanine ligase family protein [Anaerolineae bacterium]|nr:D-alanine--D-alanine ligase family protein [Anaerolineae bacterium]
MSKLRVGVLFGGRSGEHEVSLRSARSVVAAFNPQRYEVVLLAIDKQGRWLLGQNAAGLLAAPGSLIPQEESGQRSAVSSQQSAVSQLSVVARPEIRGETLAGLDVIFPVLHGPLGEDGTVQGLLELADLPYVGCGVAASAVGMDKATCKAVFATHNLPQVPYLALKRRRWETEPEAVLDAIEAQLRYPVFVKPANLGSSVGISKATDRASLGQALDEAARYDRRLVVEQGIDAREIEVSVLGNDEPLASLPGEIVPRREFYDYAAKYITDDSELLIPAPLTPQQTAEVQRLAVAAFLAIDGAGMARVDFLLDRKTDQIYLNEVNTIPGFTSISMYPKLWEASGLPFPQLLDRLIQLALERHADKSRSETSFNLGQQQGL